MIKTTVITDPTGKEPIPQITMDDIGELFLWTSITNKGYNPCLFTYDSLVSLRNPNNTWGSSTRYTIDLINQYMSKGDMIKAPKGYTVQITQE